MPRIVPALLLALASVGCSDPRSDRPGEDSGLVDGSADDGSMDASTDGLVEAALIDSFGTLDGHLSRPDANSTDSAAGDSTPGDSAPGDAAAGDAAAGDAAAGDAATGDAGRDAGSDAGSPDAGSDSGPVFDAGRDSGPPAGGCVSGASGTHALRFTWDGTSSGSVAYVRYNLNNLPDTSRWRVSAASSSIGYRPIFRDPFLGEGGLELSGTVFIDVELSTVGLSSIRNVTIAVYGRSYNTTASGSFNWQTFDGTGASPRGGVSNSAPYEWYGADATGAFTPGNDGVLLRLRAGGPSNALIVRQVEVCFDAVP